MEQQIAIQIDVYHYHLSECCRIQGLLEPSLLLRYVGFLDFFGVVQQTGKALGREVLAL